MQTSPLPRSSIARIVTVQAEMRIEILGKQHWGFFICVDFAEELYENISGVADQITETASILLRSRHTKHANLSKTTSKWVATLIVCVLCSCHFLFCFSRIKRHFRLIILSIFDHYYFSSVYRVRQN